MSLPVTALSRDSSTWMHCPTVLNNFLTISASLSVALGPRHMALAVSPTRQGVLGMTRTKRTSPAASCTLGAEDLLL